MALTFPNRSRSYDHTRDAVRFWGYQSAMEYSFFVTTAALRRMQPQLRETEANMLDAFDANRDLIYKVAARVHARGPKGSYELLATDFQ